jgi:hypothetical protein
MLAVLKDKRPFQHARPFTTVITSLPIVRSALAFLAQRRLPDSLPLAISSLPRQARAVTAVVARTAVQVS